MVRVQYSGVLRCLAAWLAAWLLGCQPVLCAVSRRQSAVSAPKLTFGTQTSVTSTKPYFRRGAPLLRRVWVAWPPRLTVQCAQEVKVLQMLHRKGAAAEVDRDSEQLLCLGDEFALITCPDRRDGTSGVGYLATGPDGTCYCEFVDGAQLITSRLYVRYRLQAHGGVLAENENPPAPDQCRIALHTLQHYTAAKLLRKGRGFGRGKDANHVQQLKKNADLEAEHNVSDTKLREGSHVVYGTTHQAYTPIFQQYMSVQKSIADEDNTALKCSLESKSERSKMPWFRIMPGYNTRSEGEPIRMGDTVRSKQQPRRESGSALTGGRHRWLSNHSKCQECFFMSTMRTWT